jgi:hypothetical protein
MTPKTEKLIRYGLIPLAIVLAALYLGRGYHNALFLPEGSNDLRLRYCEEKYVLKGVNPNAVYEVLRKYPQATAVEIDPRINPAAGGGGYPPWAYFTGLFLAPATPWGLTRVYFALLNGLSLAVMAGFAYCIIRPHGRLAATLSATLVLAMGANSFVLGSAQYGLVVNAMIAGMVLCLEKRPSKSAVAGVLFGLALVKPSISALQAMVLLVRRQWTMLAVATAYVIAASLVIWAITRCDPITMFLQITDRCRAGGGIISKTDYGPIRVALLVGVPASVAMPVTTLAGILISLLLSWRYRNASLTVQLAIAATIGYLWMPHRGYDDVMLVFLLIALVDLAFRVPTRLVASLASLATLPLWLPPSAYLNISIGYAKTGLYIYGLVFLLVCDGAIRASRAGSSLGSRSRFEVAM